MPDAADSTGTSTAAPAASAPASAPASAAPAASTGVQTTLASAIDSGSAAYGDQTSNTAATTATVTQATPINWEARYVQENEQRQAMEREFTSYRTQYDGIDAAAARSALERSKLPEDPFSDSHPAYADNLRRAEIAADWLADLETMTEDERKVYGPKLAQRRGITQDDIRLANLNKRRLDSNAKNWHQNPDKAFLERFNKELPKIEERIFAKLKAQDSAKQWFSDPTRSDLIQKNAVSIDKALNGEIPYRERVEHIAALHDKIAKYEAQLGIDARNDAHAAAQAAARGAGVPTGRTAEGERRKAIDAVDYVKTTYKILPDNPLFSQRLLEVNAKIRAGQL